MRGFFVLENKTGEKERSRNKCVVILYSKCIKNGMFLKSCDEVT